MFSNRKELVIEAQHLTRRYGNIVALRSLSLSIQAGERIAVVGPNGAGKSTLLSLLSGQLRPAEGSLRLFGKPTYPLKPDIRVQIGYVGHEPWLYEHLTALENLSFFGDLYGMSYEESALAESLQRVGIEDSGERLVNQLSRGQQQRLALARATLHQPSLLLLDEPASSLDPLATVGLNGLLGLRTREHAEPGIWRPTILLATHDLDLAIGFCQRILVLVDGRCVMDAPTAGLNIKDVHTAFVSEGLDASRIRIGAEKHQSDYAVAAGTLSRSVADGLPENGTIGNEKRTKTSLNLLRWKSLTAIIGKDLRIERRRRDNVIAAVMYAIVCLLIFNFALDGLGANPTGLVPGLLWVTITYGATVGFGRTFAQEYERGNLQALLAAPLDRSVLYAAKLIVNLGLMAVLVVVTVSITYVFFNVVFEPFGLFLSLALGSIGLCAAGTLLSAMAAETRAREILLPVLLFPIIMPALLAAVHSTADALQGRMAWGGGGDAPWFHLLIAFDFLYIVVSGLVFEFVLEE